MTSNKPKVLVLFSGTRSIEKAFEEKGHETFGVDWDEQHKGVDWYTDINNVTASDILERFGKPDVIWASPDCSTYSVAAISHHRTRDDATGLLLPATEAAKKSDELVKHTIDLITELDPVVFFIENPRSAFRKMPFVQHLFRYTVTYCQYGDERMKPTDIFSNVFGLPFRAPCKNGDSCHVSAPRGSRAGTQGLAGAVARGVIPHELGLHVVEMSESLVV